VNNGHLTEAKARVAAVLQRYVDAHFDGSLQRAGQTLGYDRRRIYTYTSGRSFPSDGVMDRIKEQWGLDLLNIDAGPTAAPRFTAKASEEERQLSLFDFPVRLANEGVEIILERKGAAIAVRIGSRQMSKSHDRVAGLRPQQVSAESVKGLLSMAWIAVVPVEFSYARHRR